MFQSLRWRLQVWHALILLLVVVGFGSLFYVEVRRARLDEIDAELLSGARVIEGVLRTTPRPMLPFGPGGRPGPLPEFGPGIGVRFPGFPPDGAGEPPPPGGDESRGRRPPPGRGPGPGPGFNDPRGFGPPGRPPRPPFDGPPEPRPPLGPGRRPGGPPQQAFSLPASLFERHTDDGQAPYLVVRARNGDLIREEPEGIADEVPPDEWVGTWVEVNARSRGQRREVALHGPDDTVIQVGRPIGRELAGLRRLGMQIALSGLGIFALGLLGGWWLSARAVRPIVSMSDTVSGITATSLSRRIDLTGVDTELGSLGGLINTMLGRLEAAFEQQARFTADASHELRTPLSVIRSYLDLALARPRTAAEYRESLASCQRAAVRMTGLVDDLLTLARADAGKLVLRRQPVDLAALVEDQVDLLEPLGHQRSVKFVVESTPTWIDGDPDRLSQLLTNLLNNAINYNRPGGRVVVQVAPEENEAVCSVADTGVGIPEEHLPRVFDRFHRVDVARNRASGGSGLGLAICERIVAAHGGTITVASRVDVGTTFTVRMPLQAAPHPAPAKPEADAET